MSREVIVKEWHDDKGLIHRREVGQELVRCKECKHYDDMWCNYHDVGFNADDFCSYGERDKDINVPNKQQTERSE